MEALHPCHLPSSPGGRGWTWKALPCLWETWNNWGRYSQIGEEYLDGSDRNSSVDTPHTHALRPARRAALVSPRGWRLPSLLLLLWTALLKYNWCIVNSRLKNTVWLVWPRSPQKPSPLPDIERIRHSFLVPLWSPTFLPLLPHSATHPSAASHYRLCAFSRIGCVKPYSVCIFFNLPFFYSALLFMLLYIWLLCSFLLLSSILPYEYTTVGLSTHVDGHLNCFYWSY